MKDIRSANPPEEGLTMISEHDEIDEPTPGYRKDCFICEDHDPRLPQCRPCPECTDYFGFPCGHIPADDTRCDFGHDPQNPVRIAELLESA